LLSGYNLGKFINEGLSFMEMNDVKIYQYDAVVVGAGLAGLAAAKS